MINRVKKLLEIEHLTPSQFADEIKLQRSSLSHVLSGRNKPSLDFVMKIKQRFSEVNLEWLIFGNGNMFVTKHEIEVPIITPSLPENKVDDTQQAINFELEEKVELPKIPISPTPTSKNTNQLDSNSVSSAAKKVVVLYNDGTFEEYINNK